MKSFILIAVLAALTVCNNAASLPNEVALGQEDVVLFQESGQVYQKDYNLEGATARLFNDDELILFHEEFVNVAGIPNTVQVREVAYRGNATTQINRIVVYNVPSHTFIGNYWTHGLVRLTSASGAGIHTTVQFFGRYTDWL